MTLLQECVVRHSSVYGDSVYRDSEVDCCGCTSPNAWCQGMRDVRDDSVSEYVNYVGCYPNCVVRTVPEGVDDYLVGTLPSEPLCVITDDMTSGEGPEWYHI